MGSTHTRLPLSGMSRRSTLSLTSCVADLARGVVERDDHEIPLSVIEVELLGALARRLDEATALAEVNAFPQATLRRLTQIRRELQSSD